jgi:hypothetical protein
MSDRELIEQGRRFLMKATQGNWWVTPFGDVYAGDGSGTDLMVVESASPQDGALIVWMRNNLPTLLDRLDSLGAVPPAAEGGRPGGDGSGPLAAPRRDMPDEQTAAIRRWYDALFAIAQSPCSNGDPAVACPDEFGANRKRWCSYCIAADALNPPDSSPQPHPLRSEAARPEPSRDGDTGSGRASTSP